MFCYLLFIKFTDVDPSNILVDDKGNFKLRLRFEVREGYIRNALVSTQTLKIKKNLIIKVQFRL